MVDACAIFLTASTPGGVCGDWLNGSPPLARCPVYHLIASSTSKGLPRELLLVHCALVRAGTDKIPSRLPSGAVRRSALHTSASPVSASRNVMCRLGVDLRVGGRRLRAIYSIVASKPGGGANEQRPSDTFSHSVRRDLLSCEGVRYTISSHRLIHRKTGIQQSRAVSPNHQASGA